MYLCTEYTMTFSGHQILIAVDEKTYEFALCTFQGESVKVVITEEQLQGLRTLINRAIGPEER